MFYKNNIAEKFIMFAKKLRFGDVNSSLELNLLKLQLET